MARPRKVIDKDLLRKLALIHCTMEEMADIFDISKDTLRRRFANIIRRARADGKMSLRRTMWKAALEKESEKMMIWLSCQHLGMSNKTEQKQEVISDSTVTIYDTQFGDGTPTANS